MKRQLCELNADGVKRLSEILSECRETKKVFPDKFNALINDSALSNKILGNKAIDDDKVFASRLELAEYLVGILGEDVARKLLNETGPEQGVGNGIWPWLAVVYWRQCVSKVAGCDRVGAERRWILKTDFRDRNYHYMGFPVWLYLSVHEFGRDALEAFLGGPVSENSAFSHECASRQEIMQNPAVLQTAVWLYHAKSAKKKLRRRIASQKDPGNIRNFVRVLKQFGMTMDFFERDDARKLWEMLPSAFNRFKAGRVPWRT